MYWFFVSARKGGCGDLPCSFVRRNNSIQLNQGLQPNIVINRRQMKQNYQWEENTYEPGLFTFYKESQKLDFKEVDPEKIKREQFRIKRGMKTSKTKTSQLGKRYKTQYGDFNQTQEIKKVSRQMEMKQYSQYLKEGSQHFKNKQKYQKEEQKDGKVPIKYLKSEPKEVERRTKAMNFTQLKCKKMKLDLKDSLQKLTDESSSIQTYIKQQKSNKTILQLKTNNIMQNFQFDINRFKTKMFIYHQNNQFQQTFADGSLTQHHHHKGEQKHRFIEESYDSWTKELRRVNTNKSTSSPGTSNNFVQLIVEKRKRAVQNTKEREKEGKARKNRNDKIFKNLMKIDKPSKIFLQKLTQRKIKMNQQKS